MALELEFAQADGSAGGATKYDFHPLCCVAWEFERDKGGRENGQEKHLSIQ
jgi:hypothetical protein